MFDQLGSLNSIRVFEAAARLGSFKAAAEELHLTPTAVSHQIRNLEAQLETVLFERRTRAVYLTEAGERLAEAARHSLQILADAIEDISGQPGALVINTTSAFASLWLVPRLQGFYRTHPDLRVVVQTDEGLVNLKRDRRVDLAIRYGLPPQESGAELLAREAFGLYGNADCIERFVRGEPVTLFETQWMNRKLPPVTAEQWFQEFAPGTKIPAKCCYDQELHVLQAALAGQGLAFLSNLLVGSTVERGWLQPYRGECRLPGLAYYLLTTGREGRARVGWFRSWLQNVLRGSAEPGENSPPDPFAL